MSKGFTRQNSGVTPSGGVARGFTRTYRTFRVERVLPSGELEEFDVVYRSPDDSVKKILAEQGIDIDDCFVKPVE